MALNCCTPNDQSTACGESAMELDLASLCKALGHPARVRIIKYLIAAKSCVCGRIVEAMPLAQSTVSQHLKILKEAGLIRGEIAGPSICYCVDPDVLNRFKNLSADLQHRRLGSITWAI